MTNEEAAKKVMELWYKPGNSPFAVFDSRKYDKKYSIGVDNTFFIHNGHSWEECFADAEGAKLE